MADSADDKTEQYLRVMDYIRCNLHICFVKLKKNMRR